MSLTTLNKQKHNQTKISMITCYDYPSAVIVEQSDIDCLLVGDSLAMTVHGFPDTTHATIDMMALHTEAVRRGTKKFIISDMPFMSYRKSDADTLDNVHKLVKAGANAVKLEGARGNLELIRRITDSGVPVAGHLGLTPQHVNVFGGFKVQGRQQKQREQIMLDAKQLEQAGCAMIVLECIPSDLATTITKASTVPIIGIGAGPHTDGQVLVWHDVLGIDNNTSFKFTKKYADSFDTIKNALNSYHNDVVALHFPKIEEHCFV